MAWTRNAQRPGRLPIRIDGAREDLQQVLASLTRPATAGDFEHGDGMANGNGETGNDANGEVVNIPLTAADDELSEIPAEMRETWPRR
ncbi:hypothetical protein MRB53_039436 [Persea americana]|nr:hypothetical protein MRB53_039436 [Persea americana]